MECTGSRYVGRDQEAEKKMEREKREFNSKNNRQGVSYSWCDVSCSVMHDAISQYVYYDT